MANSTSISHRTAVGMIAVIGCALSGAQGAKVRELGVLQGSTIEDSLRGDDEVIILEPAEIGAVGTGRPTVAQVVSQIRNKADLSIVAEVAESSGIEAADHAWVNTRLVTYVYEVLWQTGRASDVRPKTKTVFVLSGGELLFGHVLVKTVGARQFQIGRTYLLSLRQSPVSDVMWTAYAPLIVDRGILRSDPRDFHRDFHDPLNGQPVVKIARQLQAPSR